MSRVLSKEDIDRHNSQEYRYYFDQRTNKHHAHCTISADEGHLCREDSALGDTLTIGGNPELIWEMVDKDHDLSQRGFSPEEYSSLGLRQDPFPVIPLGSSVPVFDTGAVIFENGVVVTRTGKVASVSNSEALKHYGATSLTAVGDEKRTQYQVQLTRTRYRVAALMLELHGGQPQPSADHRIWFKDGDFSNCTIGNIRWVKKKNLRKLSRAS